jgi:TolB-like protein
MRARFADFLLDTEAFELRRNGVVVAVEPQVLALIAHLVQARDRLVTRDELIASVWGGRIVSDTAISSRIKSARVALGDDGTRQQWIRTVHGKGFRFVGAVADMHAAPTADLPTPALPERPSLAVLPLAVMGDAGPWGILAEALPHDLITELSRLHWLHVIARGSAFRLAAEADPRTVGRVLAVRYVIGGSLEVMGSRIAVSVQLADTATAAVLWAERYEAAPDDVHLVRSRIAACLTAAIEVRIPEAEAGAARLKSPEALDAWSAYHLGLQRMFRFTAADNAAASALFGQALALEPDFARAHAGLSFTHFQTAFLRYAPDVQGAARLARAHAEQAVTLDGLDPFVNLAMGRSFWLEGRLENSLGWLERATLLSPNYAQGVYATAWARTLLGDGTTGQAEADRAMALSPIDPLHYAMLATRALGHIVLGEAADAARWAERAARAPGAHVLIAMIAAASHQLNGDGARAARWAAEARRSGAGLTQADFFRSFPFETGPGRDRLSGVLAALGF